MIPRLKPNLDWRELIAVFSLPRKDDVERFEHAFAEEMGQKNAIAFPYGRTGLVLLLEAMGLTGREVVCPAYTCVVVPHAIVTSGNKPVFVDSQEQDFNMDLDIVPQAITEKTGAIIATSIFGYPVDLDKLDAIRKQHPHIKIIQDCAHSFTAEWKGRFVQQSGDAAIYGLNVSKIITSVFGGMVTTDNFKLAEKLRILRDKRLKPVSFSKSIRRFVYLLAVYPAFWGPINSLINYMEHSGYLDRFVKYYNGTVIDMPDDYMEKLTKVEARVGLVQIKKYWNIVNRRREIAKYYDSHLKEITKLMLPPLINGATYSHYCPRTLHRSQIIEFVRKHGIQLGQIIDYNIPEMPVYQSYSKSKELYPIASEMAKTTLNLPVWGTGYLQKLVKLLHDFE